MYSLLDDGLFAVLKMFTNISISIIQKTSRVADIS